MRTTEPAPPRAPGAWLPLVQAGTLLTALFSVATLAGGAHRYLELFSHFRLQYLVVAVVLTLVLLAMRSWRWAVAGLLVACVNAALVAPWYQTAAPGSGTGPSLKLLLANVLASNPDKQALVSLIEAEQPDLVLLQELTPARSATLNRLRDRYPHALELPRVDHFGIGVLSRLPFTETQTVASPPLGIPTLLVEVALAGEPVTIVTTHPMPPLGVDGFRARNQQLDSVADLLNEREGAKVLIGDLNATMWGHHFQRFVDRTGLHNVRRGFGVLPTWPTQLPFAMIPIDHCLVSAGFDVRSVRTGPAIGSDHLPLLVELNVRDR